MKIFTKRFFLVAVLALVLPATFYGQSIFSNDITAANPSESDPFTSGQVVVANITASGIGRGSGITGNAGGNRYNATNWNLNSFDANDYFYFTITPAAGYKINFASFQYNGQKSGTGPASYAIRTSLDNYASNIYTYSATGNSFSSTADLSAASLQNVTGAITFRFYGWGGTGATGTFSINDFIFSGTVESVCGVIATPTAAAQAFCGASTVSQLAVTTGNNPKWYAAQTGGTALEGTVALATGTYYVSQTVGICESDRVAVAVTVNEIPAAPTAAAQAFCGASTVAQLAVTTGTAPKWYAAQTGGDVLESTATLATGTYYASQTVNGCESTRTAVAVTVNEIPAAPTAAAQAFCGASTVSQLAVTTGTNPKWYAAQTGGDVLESTAALATGTYYASQTVNGCESTRTAVAVTVTEIPAAPTAAAQAFCGASTVAQLAVTTGTAPKWYAAQTGGDVLEGTAALTTGTYYASQTVNGCESTRTAVAVTVNEIPAAPTAAAQAFCGASTVAQLAVTTGTAPKWYAAQTGGDVLESIATLATGTYYASQTVNGCESTRTAVAVTVNEIPAAPTAAAQAFCGASTVAQLAVTTGTAPKWYAAQTGGDVLESTAALATGTYYVSQTVNGCESTRTAVAVTVNEIPAAPTAAAQAFCGASTVAQLAVTTGTAPKWYTAQTGGDVLESTAALTTGTYYVSQTVNGCESTRTAVVVTITIAEQPEGNATQDFEEGDTIADLAVIGEGLVWYADEDLTMVLTAGTVLEDQATYYVVSVIGECVSTTLEITVNEVLDIDTAEKNTLVAYPNPVSDKLYFKGNVEILTVEIYNLLGQAVISQAFNATELTVNVSQLSAGNYIVKAYSRTGVETIKIIKE